MYISMVTRKVSHSHMSFYGLSGAVSYGYFTDHGSVKIIVWMHHAVKPVSTDGKRCFLLLDLVHDCAMSRMQEDILRHCYISAATKLGCAISVHETFSWHLKVTEAPKCHTEKHLINAHYLLTRPVRIKLPYR